MWLPDDVTLTDWTNQYSDYYEYHELDLLAAMYSYPELKLWHSKNNCFGAAICENDDDLIKAAALEIFSQKDRLIFYEGKFWSVYYEGSHDYEEKSHKDFANELAKYGKDVLAIPNHYLYPTHWIYYTTN